MAYTPNILELRKKCHDTLGLVDSKLIGMKYVTRLMLSSAIQGGVCHFLGEGMPGGGKTRGVELMSRAIKGTKCAIIQFTPDLMPKDITGVEFFEKDTGKWSIKWGEMADAHFVIGDEVNRGDTRTQSAMLSPMSEGRIKVQASNLSQESSTRYLPKLNVFMLTQNPIEQEGTNPLPEAQQDRILYKVLFNYPSRADQKYLLQHPELFDRGVLDEVAAQAVLSNDEVLAIRDWVFKNIRVSEDFIEYALTVIRATQPGLAENVEMWNKHSAIRPIIDAVKSGCSVRMSGALLRACQVRAFLFGVDEDGVSPRDFVMPEDLKALVNPVMRHRILMKDEAALRRVKGAGEERWVDDFATDGSITKEQVIKRLNRNGPLGLSPITSDHAVDALITHIDYTDDVKKYKS